MPVGDFCPCHHCTCGRARAVDPMTYMPILAEGKPRPCDHCYCQPTNDNHRVCCNCGNRRANNTASR